MTADSWDTSEASLQLYQRTGDGWRAVGKPVAVMIGRNGFAWGRGLHKIQGQEKVEGDGRAPAGIFELAGAFGYAEDAPRNCRLPYSQATERDYWIDDASSSQYNQWVNIPEEQGNTPKERWDSFERMKREDGLYELGIIVNHNTSPVTTGKGSAIFMHIWKGMGQPTAGCTAMPKRELKKILRWLDPAKKPLLIQIPTDDIDELVLMR